MKNIGLDKLNNLKEEFVTYKKFKDANIANDIGELLRKEAVYFEVESGTGFFDPTFMNNPMNNEIKIKLSPHSFIKANTVLENYYKGLLDKVQEDHYLFSFTNMELYELIQKPDEWGDLDFQLAQKILTERGEEVSKVELKDLKAKRIVDLSKPANSQTWLIFIGYCFTIIGGIALFAGLKFQYIWFPLASILGAIISLAKKTLPTGNVIYTFNINDRKHGSIILILGIFLCISVLLLLIFGFIKIPNQYNHL